MEPKTAFSLIGVVVAGVIGFYSARSGLQQEIRDLKFEVSVLSEKLEGISKTDILGMLKISQENVLSDTQVEEIVARLGVDGNLSAIDELPVGAVVAFDRAQGCPSDWTDMGDIWRGRTLVAAVDDANDEYRFRRTAGKDKFQLSIEEIPPHRHGLAYVSMSANGLKFSDPGTSNNFPYFASSTLKLGEMEEATLEAGGTKVHENMPPYVALFFCKKN